MAAPLMCKLFKNAQSFRDWVSEEIGRVDRLGGLGEYVLALAVLLLLAAAPGIVMWIVGKVWVP